MKIVNNKVIQQEFNDNNKKKAFTFLEIEIAILKKLVSKLKLNFQDHPNVLCLHEVIDDPDKEKMYIITELLDKGCLTDRLKKKPTVTTE